MILDKYQALALENKDSVYLSILNKVFLYNLSTNTYEVIFKFKIDLATIISRMSKLTRRLLRKDIRYAYKIDESNLVLVRDKIIYRLNTKSRQIESGVSLPRGSRPLNMTKVHSLKGFSNGIYFGEYFINPKKASVKIFQYLNDELIEVYTFPQGRINHIHNIIEDTNNDCLWILTGDVGESVGIYKAQNSFKSMELIVSGDQKFRSCVAFPIKGGIIYATDSQYEQNTIRRLFNTGKSWSTEILHKMNGPCIYGTKIGENLFFSTSVEGVNSRNFIKQLLGNKKGPGINKNQSEVIRGNLKEGFSTIYNNQKDFYPFYLFQFGNIIFPSGKNISSKLIFTNIGLKNNDLSTRIMDI